jgi:hypothetical protein
VQWSRREKRPSSYLSPSSSESIQREETGKTWNLQQAPKSKALTGGFYYNRVEGEKGQYTKHVCRPEIKFSIEIPRG